MDPADERHSTAYHEAGHAVGLHIFGTPITHASIADHDAADDADPDARLGHVRHESTSLDSLRSGTILRWQLDEVVDALTPVLAGPLAEVLFRTGGTLVDADGFDYRDDLYELIGGPSSDGDEVWEGVRLVAPDDNEAIPLVQWLTVRTLRLVRDDWWPGITAVAEALVERTTLTGDELADLLGPPGAYYDAPDLGAREGEAQHTLRFRKVATGYPRAVALAYGRDLARAAADTDEQVAAAVAAWERAEGIEPRDWPAIGVEERDEAGPRGP